MTTSSQCLQIIARLVSSSESTNVVELNSNYSKYSVSNIDKFNNSKYFLYLDIDNRDSYSYQDNNRDDQQYNREEYEYQSNRDKYLYQNRDEYQNNRDDY